jgi:hypothetical protein
MVKNTLVESESFPDLESFAKHRRRWSNLVDVTNRSSVGAVAVHCIGGKHSHS